MAEVAEVVLSNPNPTGTLDGLILVLSRVAAAREMMGAESRIWISTVYDKLNDVEIFRS